MNEMVSIFWKLYIRAVKQQNVLLYKYFTMSSTSKKQTGKDLWYWVSPDGIPFLDEWEAEFFWNKELWVEIIDEKRKDQLLGDIKKAAKNHMKRKTISLRILERDLRKMKVIAMKKWIPYQTYINMVLHERIEEDYLKSGRDIRL